VWLHTKDDHVTQITPLQGGFFTLGLAVVDPPAKFKQCSFIHSRNIEGGLRFQKRSRDADHAPFGAFFLPLGLAVVDPPAKFKERSFIHSRKSYTKLLNRDYGPNLARILHWDLQIQSYNESSCGRNQHCRLYVAGTPAM